LISKGILANIRYTETLCDICFPKIVNESPKTFFEENGAGFRPRRAILII
jgi:hypothetical protein